MVAFPARTLGRAALGAILVAGLAACAETDASSSAPTISIKPESYQTRPPATLPEDAPDPTAGEDGRTDQMQRYVVKEGDYPSTIASMFEVPLEELLNANDWELTDGIVMEFPPPGEEILIPPGAVFIDPTATTTTERRPRATQPERTTGPDDTTTGSGSTTSSTINADRCAPGTYTIEEGEYPLQVAEKFDVSLDALNRANQATNGYRVFYPGLQIIIPPASDCPGQ